MQGKQNTGQFASLGYPEFCFLQGKQNQDFCKNNWCFKTCLNPYKFFAIIAIKKIIFAKKITQHNDE
ncbi:MAG: hypothetical protein EAZ58_00340 [Flavobacterium sp.]|nr:MAG: hypothetical protein EAZ58_00340 [Flavobacterium sp.]